MMGSGSRALKAALVAVVAIAFTACTVAPEIEETRETGKPAAGGATASALQTDEAITLMGDTEAVACLRSALTGGDRKIRVVEAKDLRDALYPWFEIDSPSSDDLAALLENPLVRKRLGDMGIRYAVSVSSSTTSQDDKGGILCGAGYGGAGCIGFAAWDRTTRISAAVYDVKHRTHVGSFGTKASGVSTMPAFIIPVPLIAPTESTACATLARRLIGYFSGEGENDPKTKAAPGSKE